MRSTNTYLQNVLVIAHVFGHADFFANNHWYRKSNKNMLNLAEQAHGGGRGGAAGLRC